MRLQRFRCAAKRGKMRRIEEDRRPQDGSDSAAERQPTPDVAGELLLECFESQEVVAEDEPVVEDID